MTIIDSNDVKKNAEALIYKKLIYVSHPFLTNGDKDKNIENVTKILTDLVLNYSNKYVFISPINSYGTLDGKLNYDQGLEICMDLLSKCDGIVMCGDYYKSNGCRQELARAIRLNLDIYDLRDFN